MNNSQSEDLVNTEATKMSLSNARKSKYIFH